MAGSYSRMPLPDPLFPHDPAFVGRSSELETLRDSFLSRDRWLPRIVQVTGPGGVGKTALIRQFFATSPNVDAPVWIDLYAHPEGAAQIDSFIGGMRADREIRHRDILVVLDGAERLTDKEIEGGGGQNLELEIGSWFVD